VPFETVTLLISLLALAAATGFTIDRVLELRGIDAGTTAQRVGRQALIAGLDRRSVRAWPRRLGGAAANAVRHVHRARLPDQAAAGRAAALGFDTRRVALLRRGRGAVRRGVRGLAALFRA